MGSPFVPLRTYDSAVNKLAETQKLLQQSEGRLEFIFGNPHLVALARGDLYLRKEAVAAFQVPLGYFLFHVIPDWVRGSAAQPEPVAPSSTPPDAEPRETQSIPPASPPAAVGPPPQDPGLRNTVVAVVTALAELGLIQVPQAGRPQLPVDLHPGAAPAVVGNEIAGAWAPPARPPVLGPRSAVRQALYTLLERS